MVGSWLAAGAVAFLQAHDSQVSGQIRDACQAAIAGATVSLTRMESGDHREVTRKAITHFCSASPALTNWPSALADDCRTFLLMPGVSATGAVACLLKSRAACDLRSKVKKALLDGVQASPPNSRLLETRCCYCSRTIFSSAPSEKFCETAKDMAIHRTLFLSNLGSSMQEMKTVVPALPTLIIHF